MKTIIDQQMSESDLQRLLIDAARLIGWHVYHTYDSRRCAPGFPDLVLCRPPQLLFVELKTAKGRLRPEQREWLDALRSAGQECYLWRPADIDAAISRLLGEKALSGVAL